MIAETNAEATMAFLICFIFPILIWSLFGKAT